MGKIDLQLIKERAADFFVTGNEYIRDSLNLKFIPCGLADKIAYGGGLILDLKFIPYDSEDAHRGGVILADDNQDLLQSYSIAKNVFEHVESGTIKFVLIGLSPYILPQNDTEPLVAWDVKTNASVLEDYFKLCLDNGAKPVVVVLPVHSSLKKNYNTDVLKTFRDTINQVVRKFQSSAFIDLLDIGLSNVRFQDKTHLNSEGTAIVTVLLSVRLYLKGILYPKDLCAADDEFFNVFAKYFPQDANFPNDDKPLIHRVFCILACEDFNRLSKTMPKEDCMDLMARAFSEVTYSYLANLADIFPKDDFNELMDRIFKITVENIRRKDKIKVGFHFEFSAHWCGDDLYNLFAQDKRFDPVIFIPIDGCYNNEFDRKDFLKDSEKFKARGLNVYEMKRAALDVPKQDILFRFRPYPEFIPPAFKLANIKVKETLVANVPYSFGLGGIPYDYANCPLHIVLWKVFWTSVVWLENFKKISKINTPRGFYSGYPKLDVFFKPDSKFHFDWKMARPDAKKIIYAPHWSISFGIQTATFHWNYQFMYEFAKAHPEISWVVKPHPLLFDFAIRTRIFSSSEALNEYFQKWDDLPNAKFYTGTYYNDIFATSDGMIHDSCSFIAEYQYVNKPMIFLNRRGVGMFNELAKEILNASYLVDGKNFDEIAAMIQRVFIEGDDYKAAERKAVFDKYLNYPKHNGMLASEFIYKNIIEELGLSKCKQ